MKAIILSSFLLHAAFANAQPNWQWAKGAVGTNNDNALGVITDGIGNVYVTGMFASSTITFGSTTLTNANTTGTYDMFIVKYDVSGNVLWGQRAGGTSNERGYSVATDISGNIYLTGFFASASITFGSTTLTNTGTPGTYDMCIVKYDSSGNVLWAQSTGGTNNDIGNSVATDGSGNVFVTGSFASTAIAFGSTTLTNAGASGFDDMFIVKYDNSGNVLWAQNAGGTGNDIGYSVSTDGSGNIYTMGSFSSTTIIFGSTTLTNANAGTDDIFFVKHDNNGNILWAQRTGGVGTDGGTIISDGSGNVYATGWFNSPTITFGSTTLTNATISSDIFIVKYDNNGNVLWAQRAGGANSDFGNCITVDCNGYIYVSGPFYSPTITFGSTTLFNAGPTGFLDNFIIKCDNSGNILWAEREGGNKDDVSASITTDGNGNVYLTGVFISSAITFGSTTLTHSAGGGYDMFVAKLDSSCSIASSISGNTSICVGDNTTLTATGGTTYLWSNGNTSSTIIVSPNANTTYTVAVSDCFCMSTSSITVIVSSLPAAGITAGTNVTISIGDNTILTAIGGGQYLWNTGETTASIVVSPTATTIYTVVVSDANGCTDIASVTVFAECDALYIPNAFSPNSDNENDILYVFGNCIKDMSMIIYDRWGNQVFKSNDKKDGWDGNYKDKKLNTGIFVYTLSATLLTGETINKKGNISLVR